jgi:hypothetical protein
MATQKQAQRAARKIQANMKRRGALAIDVRKLARGTGYAVYVYFEGRPNPPPPKEVTIRDKDRDVKIPVRVAITERFVPE